LFQGNKKINLGVKRSIDLNDEAGVRTNKTYQSLIHATGGYDNLSFLSVMLEFTLLNKDVP